MFRTKSLVDVPFGVGTQIEVYEGRGTWGGAVIIGLSGESKDDVAVQFAWARGDHSCSIIISESSLVEHRAPIRWPHLEQPSNNIYCWMTISDW